MDLLVTSLGLLLCCSLFSCQNLDPSGRNVCQDLRDPNTPICCTGWTRQGEECPIPVCEGEWACQKDEVCVYPGMCRCPPGFYGAHCKTRCPPEFWAPDCRQLCPCHPYGTCDPVTGACTCLPGRWGPLCQHACKCDRRHGSCDRLHGNCTCDDGWWTPACAKPCQCSPGGATGARCDQLTGACRCAAGSWGHKCSLRCGCFVSPCQQRTGACRCLAGWWGPACDRRCNCDLAHTSECDAGSGGCVCRRGYKGEFCNKGCDAGEYGGGCKMSCGHCEGGVSCSVTDGVCASCEAGWNGTRCDVQCPYGLHGDRCQQKCPRCRNGDPCDPRTGRCWRCDAGWTGTRCDQPCPDRTFGDACRFLCSPCYHGNCDHVTGRCVCQPGFQGESCNVTCPDLQFGLNCSSVCDCGEDVTCHPASGACPYSGRGALITGLLVPLVLVISALVFCCCCCGGGPPDGKDRVPVGGSVSSSSRVKHHVYNVMANVSASVPCLSAWSSGLPRVTVSHHDPELTFNHSFIEPPSCGWAVDGSSFDSYDDTEGEELYCVPPTEDVPAMAVSGGEFQEMTSKCNMFLLDPSGFSSEDVSLPFGIPRTSSNAKSKRPSVSFAEGTRFVSKDPPGPPTKPKTPWGALMLSSLQGGGGGGGAGEEAGDEAGEDGGGGGTPDGGDGGGGGDPDSERRGSTPSGSTALLQVPSGAVGRKRTVSNAAAARKAPAPDGPQAEGGGAPDKVTTVYVTVGKAGGPDPGSEGPVQAMLRRLGSLQRQSHQEAAAKPTKARGSEGVAKPPRRKLGSRASLWEQGGGPAGAGGGEASVRKPSRKKKHHAPRPSSPGAVDALPIEDATAPKRLSSILKSVPELAVAAESGETGGGGAEAGEGVDPGQSRGGYLLVAPVTDAVSLSEVIANEGVVARADDEPSYENVLIKHS